MKKFVKKSNGMSQTLAVALAATMFAGFTTSSKGMAAPANQATQPSQLMQQTESNDPDSGGVPEPVDAFPGKGVDNTGVPKPGKTEIEFRASRTHGPDKPTVLGFSAELNYGLEYYKDMQVGCIVPYVSESGKDEDNLDYKASGGGPTECHVKVLAYNNDKTGVSASVGANYVKGNNIILHNFTGNDGYNHVVVPVIIQKDINDGKISLVGSVALDHTLKAGPEILQKNQLTYGAGVGYRINKDNSVSIDATKTTQGVAWIDITYFRRLPALKKIIPSDVYGFITYSRSNKGSYDDSNKQSWNFGLQINPKQSFGENGGIFHAIKEAQDNVKKVDEFYAAERAKTEAAEKSNSAK